MGVERSVWFVVTAILLLGGLIFGAIMVRKALETEPEWKSIRIKYQEDSNELSAIYKGQIEKNQIVPQDVDASKIIVSVQHASGEFEEMSFEGMFKTMEIKTITLPEDTITAFIYYEGIDGERQLIDRIGEQIE